MGTEYVTRVYQPGDELDIISLLILGFKKWPFFDIECSPIDHWRWRYIDNPQHKNILFQVLHEDKIIATCHNLIFDLLIRGKQYIGAYGTDASVHPGFQGRGLYRVFTNIIPQMQKEVGVKFHYMVTVNPKIINSRSQRKATPYVFPHKVRYLNRINNVNHHIKMKGLADDYRWKLRQMIERLRSSPIVSPNPDIKISKIKQFDQRIDTFLDQIFESYDFIKLRSRDYLNWRYLDPRAGNYQVSVVEEKGHIIGYSVLRINKLEEYHSGYFVDLLALPGRIDVAEALLLDGLGFFSDNQVNYVLFQVVENHPYEKLFTRYGFHGGEGNRHIFYNYYGDNDLGLENISPGKYHFPFGDLFGI